MTQTPLAADAPIQHGAGKPLPWEPVLMTAVGREGGRFLPDYLLRGGYQGLKKAVQDMDPDSVIKEVTDSKLLGRGGAGFPTGVKWGGTKRNPGPRHLVVNADESEPGTYGNRYAIDADPHGLIEGMLVCCVAVGIQQAYIYIRGENLYGAEVLEHAIKEAYAAGYIGKNILGKVGVNVDISVTRGAGAYVCGEETALMESLEGRRAQPRIRPPFPIEVGGGLFGRPTVVNNVETLMCVPHILVRGAAWFASIGAPACPGPKLYTISGHVNRPGVYELPMGTTLYDLIYKYAGGMKRNQKVKAVSPGALACQLLPGTDLNVQMDTATLTRPPHWHPPFGPVGFGAGGIIVYGEETDIVQVVARAAGFFARESCGKCVPCREGTHWMQDVLGRIAHGHGRPRDLGILEDVTRNIGGRKTLCALGDFSVNSVASALRLFRPEFEAYCNGHARSSAAGSGVPVAAGWS